MNVVASDQSLDGREAFVTTDWSLVASAQKSSPATVAALEKICRIYWRPLYVFVRRQGWNNEEAEDLTQEFFTIFLARRDLEVVRREKGRLRSYLLASLKNFLNNERSRAMAMKRGEGKRPIPLDGLLASAGADVMPANHLSAEKLFERRWALTVLEQVFSRLGAEYQATEKSHLFLRFKNVLAEDGSQSQAEIAREFSMNENAVKQA